MASQDNDGGEQDGAKGGGALDASCDREALTSRLLQLHAEWVSTGLDSELAEGLTAIQRRGSQLLELMESHLDEDLECSDEFRSKLLRLLVEYGLRRATNVEHRKRLTRIVHRLADREGRLVDEEESLARWFQRIGSLEESHQIYERLVTDDIDIPIRLYCRWTEVLRLRKSDRLGTVVDQGLKCLDESGAPQLTTERLCLALADARSDAVDDVIEDEDFFFETLDPREPDGLHNLDMVCHTAIRVSRRHWVCHRFEDQRRILEPILRRCEAIGDRGWIPVMQHGIGSSHFSSGDSDGALQFYTTALEGFEEIGHAVCEATLTGTVAALHHNHDHIDRALKLYRRALAGHRRMGTAGETHTSRYGLGCALFETRRYQSALEQLERARQDQIAVGHLADAGRTALVEAWIESWAGDQRRAQTCFDEARQLFADDDPHHWGTVTELSRHHFLDEPISNQQWERWRQEIAQAPASSTARYLFSHIADRSLSPEIIDKLRRRSLAGRILFFITDKLDDRERKHDGPRLFVERGAGWFRLADDEKVDIRSRGAIRRILKQLVTQHQQAPGRGLDVPQLFEVGWPDEEATPESVANRVYWAIRTLRKMGLRDVLLTTDDGYLLDPVCTVIRR